MTESSDAGSHDVLYRAQIGRLFERSPFYAEKLRSAGFTSASDVGGLDRIGTLPFTTKDELRQSQDDMPPLGAHAGIRIAEAARIYSTSGTSGTPCYIPLTREDLGEWREIAKRSYRRSGLKEGERVVTTYNAGPFVAGAALDAFDELGITHIPVGTGSTERLVTALRLLSPHVLVCTPSYALHIAEWALERGWSVAKAGLRRVLVAGEPGGGEESFRRTLEAHYQAPVYEIMGIGDVAASLWGECEAQAGMHFSANGIVHVELIDPDSGSPVPCEDGRTGELVYTHLTRRAAPLLRFRSRDHVVVHSSPCRCGRTSLRVRCIGRTDDMLIVRGVNVFPAAIREIVARFAPRVTGAIEVRPRLRAVKQDPPLPIVVELAEGAQPDPVLGDAIAAEIRATLIFSPEIRFVAARTLPRSEYKSKLVSFAEADS
ncbi:MAG TPA: hypothetical protein VHU80_04140 [Polyangiaceae bacterium]|jgi:phenylacetate-CoA ligase|nr:hypothetical protein [Polyangiaceae bacterium]